MQKRKWQQTTIRIPMAVKTDGQDQTVLTAKVRSDVPGLALHYRVERMGGEYREVKVKGALRLSHMGSGLAAVTCLDSQAVADMALSDLALLSFDWTRPVADINADIATNGPTVQRIIEIGRMARTDVYTKAAREARKPRALPAPLTVHVAPAV